LNDVGIQAIEPFEHHDGTTHQALVSKFALRGSDGKPTFIGGIAIDITERMRMEQSLRESEERFRALVEHAFEGINIVDRQCSLIYAGPGNKSVLGYTSEEVRGRSIFETFHTDDLPTAQS